MLVLSRKIGEVVTIGSSIKITVLSYDRGVVRIGVEAPKSIPVHRKEVHDKIIEMNRLSARTELSALKKAISTVGVRFKDLGEKTIAGQTVESVAAQESSQKND